MTDRMTSAEIEALCEVLPSAYEGLTRAGYYQSAKDVLQARTAIRQLQQPWQGIETCPKGGELFLIHVPTAKRRKVSLSNGRGSGESWFERKGYTVYDDRGNPVKATAWMPLPHAPEPGQ